jgi:hypothetical protein
MNMEKVHNRIETIKWMKEGINEKSRMISGWSAERYKSAPLMGSIGECQAIVSSVGATRPLHHPQNI